MARWGAENRVPSIISSYHVSEPISGQSVLSGRDHEKVEYEDNQDNHDGNHGGNDNGHENQDAQHIMIDSGANGGLLNTSTGSKPISKNSCLKGIRWDDNVYKDFKEDRYYDSWIKSVKANAKPHGVSQVLDKDYKPLSEEAISEFEDMQTYMWAIVVNTVKTATGKQLICQHDGNAQSVFAKHHQELKESQKAEFSADDLHDKIKDLAIGKWTGTYVSIHEHWSTQLFLWCELVAGTRAYPEDVEEKKMLKTSVSTAAVMASIATQETIDVAKEYVKRTYDVYYDILMKQAIDDDRARKRVANGTQATAQMNKAE
jgi:hypothetical protein